MEYVATMAENGRLVIPKEIRKAWGLKGGQQIIFREKKGKVELEPRIKKWRALQADIAKALGDYSSDDFIAERRIAAQQEDF